MLRVCTEQEYGKYIDYIYEIAIDQSKSGYPTYDDGIKTKEMFLERSQKAFSRNVEDILLFEYEGNVEGWIHYYCIPEDNYLSTVSFNIESHTEQALQEFIEFVQEQFRGYDLFLGYSKDNKKAIEYLKTHGFECIEENYNNTIFLDRYEAIKASDNVIRVCEDNYEYFRVLHSKIEGEMYWNSERIYKDISNWVIFVYMNKEEPIGSVYYMIDDDGWYEIFGIDLKDNIFDKVVFDNLLKKALTTAKELGGKYMTFFCNGEEQKIVNDLGAYCVGEYVCYKKVLMEG